MTTDFWLFIYLLSPIFGCHGLWVRKEHDTILVDWVRFCEVSLFGMVGSSYRSIFAEMNGMQILNLVASGCE